MYNIPTPYYPQYAQGGSVKHGLAAAAEQLRQRGRGGDTVLAHINPQEAGILKALGGSGTINPRTGLPEFWGIGNITGSKGLLGGIASSVGLGDVYKGISGAVKDVGDFAWNAANDVAEALGPVGVIVGSIINPALGAAMAGLAAPGNSFDFRKAALTGATAYAGGELLGGTGGGDIASPSFDYAGEFGADPFGSAASGAGVSVNPVGYTPLSVESIPAAVSAPGAGASAGNVGLPSLPDMSALAEASDASMYTPVSANVSSAEAADIMGGAGDSSPQSMYSLASNAPQAPVMANPDYALATGQSPQLGFQSLGGEGFQASDSSILGQTPSAWDTAKEYLGSAKDFAKAAGPYAQAGSLGLTAYSGIQAKKEQDKYNEEVKRAQEAIEGKKAKDKAFAEEVMQDYPMRFENPTEEDVKRWFAPNMAVGGAVPPHDSEYGNDDQMATGGLMGLARGGMPPRFLSGGGDGMSDSIHANIDGRQEARLADGEFVVPADVVSHIGNGSSKAGAKKLYAMMDRVRQARTGKNSQAPQINARRLMPA